MTAFQLSSSRPGALIVGLPYHAHTGPMARACSLRVAARAVPGKHNEQGLKARTLDFSRPGGRTSRYSRVVCPAKRGWAGGSRSSEEKPQRPGWNELLRNDDLESHKVDPELRNRVLDAVQALGNKGTVGDVAARAGTQLGETERALQALAADTHGTLQVSNEGEILYVFPDSAKSLLAAKSFWVRTEPVFKGVQWFAGYMVRLAFGAALFASVALVWCTLLAISSSGSSDRDRQDGPRLPVYFNLADLWWYMDPWYYTRSYSYYEDGQRAKKAEMGVLESIFSFVFGEGDPNAGMEGRRWQLVGQFIQSKGGVVAAEQLAPYLDPPAPSSAAAQSPLDKESFMMPVLLRFGGVPKVDSRGNVLYEFPSLQATGRNKAPPPPAERAIQEAPWRLSRADTLGKAIAVVLGALNFVGVVALSTQLQEPAVKVMFATSSLLRWVNSALPALGVYAVAFFAIPAIRWVMNAARNRAIAERNEARIAALQLLANPSPELKQKLASASTLASSTTVGGANVLYRTDSGLDEQPQDWELNNFDSKLKRAASSRMASSSSGTGGPAAAAGQLPPVAPEPVPRAQPYAADNGYVDDGGDWRQQIWQKQRQRTKGDGTWGS